MTNTILFHDSETIGLCGVVKLHQFSIDGGPVQMIPMRKGWENDSQTRKKLFQLLKLVHQPDTIYCGFNIAFDLFHLYRVEHRLLGFKYDSRERPVTPFECQTLDLQVHAMLKSPLAPFAFNKSAGRSVAVVRRIPRVAQEYVADMVCQRIKPLIPNSFGLKVGVHQVPKRDDLVTLSFNIDGRLSLKGLMKEYGLPTINLAEVWPLPKRDEEKPWLPYPDQRIVDELEPLCDSILMNPRHDFYKYSKLDILYLRALYEKLNHPQPEYNSDLCHNIAYLRYYGFDLDNVALLDAERFYGEKVSQIEKQIFGINLRSSKDRLKLLKPHFPLLASTSKNVLEIIQKTENPESEGYQLVSCMLEYGPARQRLLQIQKIRESRTGKSHPDLKVMGTPTNRNAGTGGFNWQGIGAVEEYPVEDSGPKDLADELDEEPADLAEAEARAEAREYDLKQKVGLRHAILTPCVGDWSNYEVVIAAEVYEDNQLKADLDEGISLHSMGCVEFDPRVRKLGVSYEEFEVGRKHNLQWANWRKDMKRVIFGSFYFCTATSVANSLGVTEHEAQEILDRLYSRYQKMGEYRRKIERDFITADTTNWSEHSVSRMKRSLVDLTGFERRWDFEADMASVMWELGCSKKIRSGLSGSVVRSVQKGVQSIDMAITSACLGSALAIQAAVSRQAGNMRIQATGASINKMLQARIWNKLRVPTLNIHDENLPPHHPNFNWSSYSGVIEEFVEEKRSLIPRLKFDYAQTERWSDK